MVTNTGGSAHDRPPGRDAVRPAARLDADALRIDAETLNETMLGLVSELDLETLMQKVTDAGTRLTAARFGAFFYNATRADGERYQLFTLSGAPREAFEKLGMPRATKLFGPTFRGESVVRIDDVLADPRYGHNPPHHGMPEGHLPVRSYLAIPVLSRAGEVLGGLFFGHPDPGVFGERSERMGRSFAAQASIAIENARSHAKARHELEVRASSEAALRESERRFRWMADHAPVLIWIAGTDNNCTWFNKPWLDFTGRTLEQELGDGWTRGIHPDDFDRCLAGYREAFDARRQFQLDYRLRRHDGEYRWIQDTGTPSYDSEGGFTGFIGSCIDITGRVRSEEASAHLAAIVTSSQDAIVGKTIDGIITSWNAAAERMYGYTPAEAIGRSVKMLIPPEGHDEEDEILRRIGRGERVEHFETVRVTKDGRRFDVSLTISPIQDASGRIIGASKVARDITERRRTARTIERLNRQLRDRVNQLQALLDVLPVGVFIANDPDCQRISTNPAGAAMLRLPSLDANASKTGDGGEPLPFRVFQGGQEIPDSALPMQRCARSGEEIRGEEYEVVFEDGSVTHLLESVTPLVDGNDNVSGCVGVFIDITQRKKTENELRESEERFRALAMNSPAAVFVKDLEGRYTVANPVACRVLGRDDVTGLTDHDLMPAELTDVLAERDRQVIATGRPGKQEERVEANGVARDFLSAKFPLRDASGRSTGVCGVAVEITGRKRAEEQLRRAKEGLEQRVAERTAELRALTQELIRTERRERKRLAQVLHDEIQQLLAAVKMQADVSLLRPGEPEPIHRLKELTDEAISSCRLLTTGLRPTVLRDADMSAALHWLARHMYDQHQLRVRIGVDEVSTELSEETRVLLFETTRELLFNVVKHAAVDEARIRFGERNGDVFVEVADKGAGCHPSRLMYRPGRDNFGLFSIRERLEGFGGWLEAESRPGQGCRVRAAVPAASAGDGDQAGEGYESGPDRRPGQAPHRQIRQIRVILVDDHQILRQGLAELLGSHRDIDVVAQASDGVEAIELTREHRPHVVVMDITMPRMNGVEATRAISAEMPEVRVIGLSMHEQEDMAAAMRDAGAEAFLTKAGPIDELLAVLRGESDAVQ